MVVCWPNLLVWNGKWKDLSAHICEKPVIYFGDTFGLHDFRCLCFFHTMCGRVWRWRFFIVAFKTCGDVYSRWLRSQRSAENLIHFATSLSMYYLSQGEKTICSLPLGSHWFAINYTYVCRCWRMWPTRHTCIDWYDIVILSQRKWKNCIIHFFSLSILKMWTNLFPFFDALFSLKHFMVYSV